MAQDKPVHEIRMGKVKAAIWRNETEVGTRYSVLLSRIYKTDDGWESSSSFGRDELPLVAKVADMAHTWIYQQNDRSENGERNGDTLTRSRSDKRVTKSSSSR
jgi:hypothetical protein